MRKAVLAVLSIAATLVRADEVKEERTKIEQTFHIVRPLPKLEEKKYGMFIAAEGVEADRVSYATGYYMRVPAIVYHASGKKRKRGPALVIVNGHGGDKSSPYATWAGILYARAGGVVLTYDPIGEFERNHLRMSKTSQHDPYVGPEDMGRRMTGLMIEDILQGVQYLARRKDVDRKRIAVLGFSMGSFLSSIACAIEPRVKACVLTGGGDLDGPGGYWDSSDRRMCQSIAYRSLQFLGDRGAAIFALNARRGPTLIYNAADDKVVDMPHHGPEFFAGLRRRTMERLGGHDRNVFTYQFAREGGHRPYFVTKPVALWLEEQLNFPKWTPSEVAQIGETRMADGTMALGQGIPQVSRDLLHAIPEVEWQEERGRYVYETWVGAARAAIASGAP